MAETQPMRHKLEVAKTHMRSFLLLETAERTVRARRPDQQAAVRSYCDAAARRASVADGLADDSSAVAALVLYRESAALLVAAIAASTEPGSGEGAAPAAAAEGPSPATVERLVKAGALPAMPQQVEDALRFLGEAAPMAFDELPADEVVRRRFACESAVRWLRARVEARTLPEIRASRTLRVGALAAVAAVLLGWVIVRLVQPTDLALHKPVTVSGRLPASTAPADNSGLVNGSIESTYGVHTNVGSGWVMVDLLASHKLSKIRIYNRADGYFSDGLPMTLELSQDGRAFTLAETRTAPFSSVDPWTFIATGRPARYIRVRSNAYVALTELEAYGD